MTVLVEVTECRPVHSLPHRPQSFVLGVVNVGGRLVPCVSLARLLQTGGAAPLTATSQSHFERLLVVASNRGRLAFPTNEVAGPWRHRLADPQEPLGTAAPPDRRFIRAILPWHRSVRARHDAAPESETLALLDEQPLFQFINQALS
jgi:chemotaxis-related protein WspD